MPATNHATAAQRHAQRVTAALAAAAAVALTLAGCSSSGGSHDPSSGPATTPTTSTPSTATPTTTPTQTPEQIAGTQAVALVREYYSVVDESRIDPAHAPQLNTVAMGAALTAEIHDANELLTEGGIQHGRVKIVSLTAGATSLMNEPAATPPIYPSVTVTSCIDVRGVSVVDSHGRSLVAAGRSPFFIESLTVDNFRYPGSSTWRVATATNRGAPSCDGT